MPMIPVNDLGTIGIVRDSPAHDLAPGAWTDGQNVQFGDMGVRRVLGHTGIYGTLSGNPYWVLSAYKDGNLYWIYPDLDAVYATNGQTHVDITQAATTYNATASQGWNGGTLNGVPVLNNGFDAPQFWDRDYASPGLLADLSNWPPGGSSALVKVMRPFRNFLVGFDYTEDATRFEDMVIWSHGADPGTLPSSWDYADPTKAAGRIQLSELPGPIVDAKVIGADLMVVYKGEGVWGMQHIGGGPVFRFWRMFDLLGALSRQCVVSFRKKHLVLTPDADLVVHDTRDTQRIGSKRVSRWLQRQIDPDNYDLSFLTFNPHDRELWVCYPDNGETSCTSALTWNWEDGTFGQRELPNLAHVGWGIVSETVDDTWDADTGLWDTDTTFWDQLQYNPAQYHMLFCKPDASTPKFYKAPSGTDFDGTEFTAYVERQGLALVGQDRKGALIVDIGRRKLLKGIWPKLEATGPINVFGLAQERKDGPVVYSGPHAFDARYDKKIDLTISGRLLGARFEFPAGVEAKLVGYDLDIELGGMY